MLSSQRGLAALLIPRLPFYYGWVILACVCSAGFARQGPAVATLSIFVEPMTSEFGWSRTALSGAVSLGGFIGRRRLAAHRPRSRPTGRPAYPLHRRARHQRHHHAAVADAVAARLLHPVLHRPHELRRHLRPRHLRCAQQLVRGAARFRHGDRQPGDDGGPRRASFHRASRHAGRRLAGRLAGGGRHGADRRFVPTWLFMVRRPEDVGLVPDRLQATDSASATGKPAPALAEPSSRAERRCARLRSGCCRSTLWRSSPCRRASACTRRRT